MNRRQKLFRIGFLASVLAVGVLPSLSQIKVHADSYVWVADDETASISCTVAGKACPPGAVLAAHVHTIPLSQALEQQRPYLTTSASRQQVLQFAGRQVHAPSQSALVVPNTCGGSYKDQWTITLPDIRGTVSNTDRYSVDSSCNRHAQSYSTSYVSGPRPNQDEPGLVADKYFQVTYDSDGLSGCPGLTHSANFSGQSIPSNVSYYTWLNYSSGNNCTIFDTYNLIGYQWIYTPA